MSERIRMVKLKLNKNGTIDKRTKEYKEKEIRKNLKARYVSESELSESDESNSESELSESESELSSELSSDSEISLPKKKSGLRKGFKKGNKRK